MLATAGLGLSGPPPGAATAATADPSRRVASATPSAVPAVGTFYPTAVDAGARHRRGGGMPCRPGQPVTGPRHRSRSGLPSSGVSALMKIVTATAGPVDARLDVSRPTGSPITDPPRHGAGRDHPLDPAHRAPGQRPSGFDVHGPRGRGSRPPPTSSASTPRTTRSSPARGCRGATSRSSPPGSHEPAGPSALPPGGTSPAELSTSAAQVRRPRDLPLLAQGHEPGHHRLPEHSPYGRHRPRHDCHGRDAGAGCHGAGLSRRPRPGLRLVRGRHLVEQPGPRPRRGRTRTAGPGFAVTNLSAAPAGYALDLVGFYDDGGIGPEPEVPGRCHGRPGPRHRHRTAAE